MPGKSSRRRRPAGHQWHELKIRRELCEEQFDEALDRFQCHYALPDAIISRLRDELMARPYEIGLREKRLLMGLPPLVTDFKCDRFKGDLITALKDMGRWQKMPDKDREKLRKRLVRHGSTIAHAEGRPPYPYAELEKSYAEAIIKALDQSPRIKRLRARTGGTAGQRKYYSSKFSFSRPYVELRKYYSRKFPFSRPYVESRNYSGSQPCGPALDLLTAALDLALPFTGAGDNESRVDRLKHAFPTKPPAS
jgi:hypothetical protein